MDQVAPKRQGENYRTDKKHKTDLFGREVFHYSR